MTEVPRAILFDRDGTLIRDVAHNADPDLVVPMPGARAALALVRGAGVAMAVVSNQSVIGRGWATRAQVDATNARVEQLLGPIGTFHLCPHRPGDGCRCRKPAPGLIEDALRELGVAPAQAALVGDHGSDLRAAAAAGVRGVLVPTPQTDPADLTLFPTAPDIDSAVRGLLHVGPATS